MAVIAVLVLFYIIIGMFLEIFSAVILTVPIILPALLAMGIDPIWFGVIIVLVINMGLVTPPVGIAAYMLYMLAGMTGVPSFTVFRGVVPFLIAAIICIIILAIFPQIALFLPGTM